MRSALLVLVLWPLPTLAGEVSPWLIHPPKGIAPHLHRPILRVHATLEEPPSARMRTALARAGAREVEVAGGLAAVGRVISLDVPREKLRSVASVRGVVRLDPGIPLLRLAPLDRTTQLVGAPSVWTQAAPADPANVGTGVVVADHEQGWDPFHPDLFFPDGGLFTFADADRDGRLSAGDTVVVDGRRQTISILESGVDDLYLGTRVDTGLGFQPEIDWAYVDLNGNGVRDFGRGFANRPALGEPIFSGDDVDGSGALELGEKLVRLGTPKVRAIYDEGVTFTRGTNLEQYEVTDGSHGIGATGILAAGWPELRRFTGVAPGVELVLIKSEDTVAGLAASNRLGARLHYWEFISLVEIHDGSSPLETAISDDAAGTGVHVTASGNIGGSGHNLVTSVPRNRTVVLPFDTVPPGFPEPQVIVASLTWIGDAASLAVAIDVDGQRAGVVDPTDITQLSIAGIDIQAARDHSARGTSIVQIAFIANNGVIPLHHVELSVTSTRAAISELRGLLVDDVSGWGPGAFWTALNTNEGTAMNPSTADRTITVGAYGGIHDFSAEGLGAVGEVRAYSGTGPRVDGARTIDVIAPDDPFAPSLGARYESFGGTSGALPHATGVAALFLAANPRARHDEVERALTDSASSDRFTGRRPNASAGFGKVSASALFGQQSSPGSAPRISLRAEGTLRPNAAVRVVADVSDTDGRVVRVDWDEGYDRVYEGSTTGPHVRGLSLDALGRLEVVARVLDEDGQSSRARLTIDATVECLPSQCRGPDGSCRPCATDAGVSALDRRPPDSADVRPPPPLRRDASADAGPLLPDGDIAGVEDAGRPRRLETIPEAELSCGCRSTGVDGPLTILLVLAIVTLRKSSLPN